MKEVNALDTAVKQIEKRFGTGSVMRLGDKPQGAISSISTGAVTLDLALGVGGLPRGRIIEIFGPESSGKTTLSLHVVAEAQRIGGIAAYIDVEHALDPGYAAALGVDIDNLLVAQPDAGEDALEIADMLVHSGSLTIVVIDSVAALTPRAEIEGEMGISHVGLQARLMSQALRKLTPVLSKTNAIALFVNQLRDKIGTFYGSPETTPGGRALKFYASVRLDVRRVETIKDGSLGVGNRTRVKVVKNKCSAPYQSAEFDILFGRGIDQLGCVLDAAVSIGLIAKNGAWYSLNGVPLGQGRSAARSWLQDHPDELEQLNVAIRQTMLPSVEADCPVFVADEDQDFDLEQDKESTTGLFVPDYFA